LLFGPRPEPPAPLAAGACLQPAGRVAAGDAGEGFLCVQFLLLLFFPLIIIIITFNVIIIIIIVIIIIIIIIIIITWCVSVCAAAGWTLCDTCLWWRQPRAKHCTQCQRCVVVSRRNGVTSAPSLALLY
jgi:hypothetical protein